MSFQRHLTSASDLVTSYAETRAGFIQLALEKNEQATPFVERAKVLKAMASEVGDVADLLDRADLRSSLLTAAGVSDKAKGHMQEPDQAHAIQGLIEKFLEPAGKDFVDELVFRFLLVQGDTLGGKMRNIGGVLAERKVTRTLIAILSLQEKPFSWLNSKPRKWIKGDGSDPTIELNAKGLYWTVNDENRTLLYNLNVPIVRKNVDLNLFSALPKEVASSKTSATKRYQPDAYLALGELKGGVDPAGADEHWKTANSALQRVRSSFQDQGHQPKTFFVGAAIQPSMAEEIFAQLNSGQLSNAANLTSEEQLVSLCRWLTNL